jgi:hypothetical protein
MQLWRAMCLNGVLKPHGALQEHTLCYAAAHEAAFLGSSAPCINASRAMHLDTHLQERAPMTGHGVCHSLLFQATTMLPSCKDLLAPRDRC